MCTLLLCWRLNLTLQVSQDSASTCFRWSGRFRYSFVESLFWDSPSNFYRNRFIFDRQGAKNKLAQFFWDTVYMSLIFLITTDKWSVYLHIICIAYAHYVCPQYLWLWDILYAAPPFWTLRLMPPPINVFDIWHFLTFDKNRQITIIYFLIICICICPWCLW